MFNDKLDWTEGNIMVNLKKTRTIKLQLPHCGNVEYAFFYRENSGESGGQAARTAVVFGRNGSGKSSIAHALAAGEAEFLDANSNAVSDGDDISNIYVFNDGYIDENFRQRDSVALEPIVLLGAAAERSDIEDKLDQDAKITRRKLESKRVALEDSKRSVDDAHEKIKSALRGNATVGEGSWKGRTKLYNQDGQFQNLRQPIIDKIIAISRKKNENDAPRGNEEEDFRSCVAEIKYAAAAEHISWTSPKIEIPYQVTRSKKLFHSVEEFGNESNDSASDLETNVRTLGVSAQELRHRKNQLFSGGPDNCPTCFQEISPEFASLARAAIDRYLSEMERNSSISALREALLPPVDIADPPNNVIGGDSAISGYIDAQVAVQERTAKFNEAVRSKADNPLSQIDLGEVELGDAYDGMSNAVDQLVNAIDQHNRICANVEKERVRAAQLNSELAAVEIADWVLELKSRENTANDKDGEVQELERELEELTKKLQAVRDERRSERRAALAINRLLKKVFGLESMLLEAREDGYAVLNRGKDVSPQRLSTGERNILSLCYFLISISESREFYSSFSAQQLIVLDDPVSSFDRDNRYGVISLLCWVGTRIAEKSSNTKLLVLTHDPGVAFELSKGLTSTAGSNFDWQLLGGELKRHNHENTDFYRENLKLMVDLSLEEPSSDGAEKILSQFPANSIRRVWEAYVTFELGGNVSNVTRSAEVVATFEKMGQREAEFLASYPGRVFVHVDSHSATQMRFENLSMEPSLGFVEYQRFSREMVVFMHLMSPRHIPSRVADNVAKWREYSDRLDELVNEVLPPAVSS